VCQRPPWPTLRIPPGCPMARAATISSSNAPCRLPVSSSSMAPISLSWLAIPPPLRRCRCSAESIKLPIVGMEPAVKPATAATRSGTVGVLATVGTLQSVRFAALLDQFGGEHRGIDAACPGLVEQVEAGDLDGPQTRTLVDAVRDAAGAGGADTLVLGCTHFAFLRPLIEGVAGPDVKVIDTGEAVARRVAQVAEGLGDSPGHRDRRGVLDQRRYRRGHRTRCASSGGAVTLASCLANIPGPRLLAPLPGQRAEDAAQAAVGRVSGPAGCSCCGRRSWPRPPYSPGDCWAEALPRLLALFAWRGPVLLSAGRSRGFSAAACSARTDRIS
jgi:hypothetical protein